MFPLLMKYNILLTISFGRQAGGEGEIQSKIKHYQFDQTYKNLFFSFNLIKIAP